MQNPKKLHMGREVDRGDELAGVLAALPPKTKKKLSPADRKLISLATVLNRKRLILEAVVGLGSDDPVSSNYDFGRISALESAINSLAVLLTSQGHEEFVRKLRAQSI